MMSTPHVQRPAQAAVGFDSTLADNRARFGSTLISDQVYALIRRAIVDQELAPGERVVESEVARRLGVSQAPVREAVKRLAHEGLLTHVPRRGNFVAEVSEHDAEQARQVREPLERLAGQLAAERIDEQGLAELDEIVEQMYRAVTANDVTAFHDLDIVFHERVYRIAGNPFLIRIWEMLVPSLRGPRAVADPLSKSDWRAMAHEHGRLVALLREGHADQAAMAFADHAAGRWPVPDRRRTRRQQAK